jgi:hypothetical protein
MVTVTAQAQQPPATPARFTAYVVQGEDVNVPPLPLRLEGDRIVAPEGGMFSILESHLTDDRITMTMETPVGPVGFLGIREGMPSRAIS